MVKMVFLITVKVLVNNIIKTNVFRGKDIACEDFFYKKGAD